MEKGKRRDGRRRDDDDRPVSGARGRRLFISESVQATYTRRCCVETAVSRPGGPRGLRKPPRQPPRQLALSPASPRQSDQRCGLLRHELRYCATGTVPGHEQGPETRTNYATGHWRGSAAHSTRSVKRAPPARNATGVATPRRVWQTGRGDKRATPAGTYWPPRNGRRLLLTCAPMMSMITCGGWKGAGREDPHSMNRPY